jgi:hypothetical protein
MVEYGNGVSGVAGQVAGGRSAGAGPVDLGAGFNQFVTNSVHTISTLPPAELVGLSFVVVIGLLLILKRAF